MDCLVRDVKINYVTCGEGVPVLMIHGWGRIIDYCGENRPSDIMYSVDSGDEITGELSRVDAYYVGLTDSCSEVSDFALGGREYGR